MSGPVSIRIVKGPALDRLVSATMDATGAKALARAVRQGPDGWEDQISGRVFVDGEGARRRWREPHYVRGAVLDRARALEAPLWDAALGKSSAGKVKPLIRGTQVGAVISVDDIQVRQESARLGNGIVSQAPYFPFVTGVFSKRQFPAPAVPVKHSRLRNAGDRARFAMFLFLLLTYKYVASTQEMGRGILTPPKNLGVSPKAKQRVLKEFLKRLAVA